MEDQRIEEVKVQMFMPPVPSLPGHRKTTEGHSTCQVAMSYNCYDYTLQVQETVPQPPPPPLPLWMLSDMAPTVASPWVLHHSPLVSLDLAHTICD